MNILIILIPLAIMIATVFVAAFIWATYNGQYDDLQTPAFRILIDDEKSNDNKNSKGLKK